MKIRVVTYSQRTVELWLVGCCVCSKSQFTMNEAYYLGKSINWLNHDDTVYLCDQCNKKYKLTTWGREAWIPYNHMYK